MKICSIFILFAAGNERSKRSLVVLLLIDFKVKKLSLNVFFCCLALAYSEVTAIETKTSRNVINLFDPVLSANAYVGHVKENERVINIEPALNAFDADRSNSPNGLLSLSLNSSNSHRHRSR